MKILIIEDEKDTREILCENFKKEKFLVDFAEDGKKGLFLASTNDYDTIVLDYMLPELSGKEICLELRKQKICTPIIMLTAKTEIEDKVDMINLGADDYLPKPYLFEELLARVKALMRRPKEIENDIISVGDIIIEVSNFKVIRDNKEINLTQKEFLILVYLARNIDKIVSQEDIIKNAWDMNANILSKAIKTHIMNLRRKINQGQTEDIIHNFERKGYMLSFKNK